LGSGKLLCSAITPQTFVCVVTRVFACVGGLQVEDELQDYENNIKALQAQVMTRTTFDRFA